MEEEEEEEGGQLLAREAIQPTNQPPPRPASVRERPRKAWEVGGGWTRSVSQLSGVNITTTVGLTINGCAMRLT